MTTMRLIIDRDGSIWSAYDESLVERWGYPEPDFDLPSFAIRNFGAIDISVEETKATLTFRWMTVKSEALASALQLLERLPVTTVTIRCETHEWSDQHFADVAAAIEWIESKSQHLLGGKARSVITTPRKLNALAERPLSRIEDGDDSLALLFKKWRLTQGRFSEDILTFMVRFGMLDRSVITRQKPGQDVMFEHVGSAITLYDRANPDWTYMVAGRPVADQPDREYGRWAATLFRDTLDRSQPTFDHVDAVIRDTAGAARFRYDRLLLPWASDDQSRIVTSLSFKTDPDAVLHA